MKKLIVFLIGIFSVSAVPAGRISGQEVPVPESDDDKNVVEFGVHTIDGITYRLFSEYGNYRAEVLPHNETGQYKGDIYVPDCVSYQDMPFRIYSQSACSSFSGNTELTSLSTSHPNGVNVGNCTKLKNLELREGVIGSGEVRECPSLENLIYPATCNYAELPAECKNLKSITFKNLNKIVLSSSWGRPTDIDWSKDMMPALTDVYFMGDIPPLLEDATLKLDKDVKIHIPSGSKEAYKKSVWNNGTLVEDLPSVSSYVKWDYCGQDEDASCGLAVGRGDNDIEYAMRIPAGHIAAYKGCQITAIEFYTCKESINDPHWDDVEYVFITSPGIDYLVKQAVKPFRGAWMRVELDQPYTITGDELFVGIGRHRTFGITWANLDGGENVCWNRVMGADSRWPALGVWSKEAEGNPLPIRAIIKGENLPADMAITKMEIIGSGDESEQVKRETAAVTPMVPKAKVVEELSRNSIFSYITDGEGNCYAAKPASVSQIPVQSTAGQKVRMKLLNRTPGRPVRVVTFDWSLDGRKQEPYTAITFIMPNSCNYVCMDLPDNIAGRNHDVNITVSKINGVPDEIAENSNMEFVYATDAALTFPRKIVMEEATGTWCGYCPSGMAVVENMYRTYPDNFIAIAIHTTRDEMYPRGGSYDPFLEAVPFYPNCQINRKGWMKLDGFDVDYWADMKDKGAAMIRARAAFASGNKVEVNTETVFGFDDNGTTEYRIAYVVVEDKVGPYEQANGYSDPDAADDPDDLLNWWRHQGSSVEMPFSDVARAIYDYDGIAGQLPLEIEAEKTYTCSYTFTLPDNIQNAENLRIVTLLLDTTTGEILNADSTPIDGTPDTAIEDVTFRQPEAYDIYDVSGVKVRQQATSTHGLSKGIYIVNGRKVVIR